MYKQKMNKELKDYLYMLVGSILTPDDYRKILDYFNQLKQERDHYKNKTINNLYMKDIGGEKVFCLENDKETFRDMIFELQDRIDKAIDYLKSDNYWLSQVKANNDLLDILKGRDEDEKD